MDLIRNKLQHLANFLLTQQHKLDDYLKTFPNTQSDAVQATDSLVQGLNEVTIYIATSISQSCKYSSSSDTNKDRLQYSPEQVSKACKIKANMEQIRYAFLGPSSQRNTEIAQIQALLKEALELCPNQPIYSHFKGATKGRNFNINEPLNRNSAKKQQQDKENEQVKLKMKDQKRILYEEVSKHLHAEQQKRRKQEKYKAFSPIKAHNTRYTMSGHVQSKQRIFPGQRKQCHPHRKKYNYLQAFQREEQRLKDQAKYVIINSSKTQKQVNSTSTHENSKSIEKINEQRPVKVTEFILNKDGDSMPLKSKQAQLPLDTPRKPSTGPSSSTKNQDLHEVTQIIASRAIDQP